MLRLRLDSGSAPLTILAIGSHSDDVEIGCGGTLMQLFESMPRPEVHWVVLSGDGERGDEARRSAEAFLAPIEQHRIVCETFRDGFLPYSGGDAKEVFERLKREVVPDLVFTHHRSDLHQDHRLVSELTWNTFRDHLILEYEIPKYDGDFGSPNVFVHLDEAACERKVNLILEQFPSQRERHWFTRDLFLASMRLRGMESNSPSGYAEAFYCRKAVL